MNEAAKRANPFENLGPENSDLSEFRPRAAVPIRQDTQDGRARQKAAVAEVALESGFHINNNEEAPIKASGRVPGPKTFLKTMRLQIGDYNKFQRWCNENGYSQQDGFNRLVKHIPKNQP